MRNWQRTLPCCSVCRHGRRPIVGKPRRKNKPSIIIRMLEIAAELPAVDVLTKRLLAEQQRRLVENKLAHYKPSPRQLGFHAAGATHRERLLCAGNQLGKTTAGGFELAMHATGRYPDWWQGKRFDRPITAWACG